MRQLHFYRSNMKKLIPVFLGILFLVSCQPKESTQNQAATDPLPSWNEGPAKKAILNFVSNSVIEGASFINEVDRIAVFDNDGTLWSEQPLYFQFVFAMDRVKALAPENPEWANIQPFKAVLEDDMKTVMESGLEGLLQLTMASHAGMTTDEFNDQVRQWIQTAKHPETGLLYKDMVYKPMLEVLDYLRANGYKTFIVSGGGIDFMRVFAQEVYGIPPYQVVGSSGKIAFESQNGNPVLVKLPEIGFINDKGGKPIGIHQHIGQKPYVAFGNSDGDLQMLQWTATQGENSLMVYIHHTDEEREWAYGRESHIGKLDKGLDEAMEKGWTVVDMKKDWKTIW